MNIQINDYVIPQLPLIAQRISIQVCSLELNTKVELRVIFYSSTDKTNMAIVNIQNIVIEGDEYNAWGNDDNYLINIVLSKLGIQPISSEANTSPNELVEPVNELVEPVNELVEPVNELVEPVNV